MHVRLLGIRFVERSHPHEAHAIAGAGIVTPQCHEALRATRDALALAAVGRRIDHLNAAGQQLNAIRLDHCVQYKGAAGFPLAPTAMATVHEEWLAGHAIANVAAAAAALLGSRRYFAGCHGLRRCASARSLLFQFAFEDPTGRRKSLSWQDGWRQNICATPASSLKIDRPWARCNSLSRHPQSRRRPDEARTGYS